MTQTRKHHLGAALRPDLFRALCDPTRLAILGWLATERAPRTVSEVAASGACPVDLSVVSRHLATLRDAGVLGATRRGREVFYSFQAAAVVRTLRDLADALESCCVSPSTKDNPE